MVSQVVIFALEVELEFLVVADLFAAVNFQVLRQVFFSDKSHLFNTEVIETHCLSAGKKAGVF